MAQTEINTSLLSALWDFYQTGDSFDIKVAGVDNIGTLSQTSWDKYWKWDETSKDYINPKAQNIGFQNAG